MAEDKLFELQVEQIHDIKSELLNLRSNDKQLFETVNKIKERVFNGLSENVQWLVEIHRTEQAERHKRQAEFDAQRAKEASERRRNLYVLLGTIATSVTAVVVALITRGGS